MNRKGERLGKRKKKREKQNLQFYIPKLMFGFNGGIIWDQYPKLRIKGELLLMETKIEVCEWEIKLKKKNKSGWLLGG